MHMQILVLMVVMRSAWVTASTSSDPPPPPPPSPWPPLPSPPVCPGSSCRERDDPHSIGFTSHPCHCDELCNTYADCCYDAEFRDASKQRIGNDSDFECLSNFYTKRPKCKEGWVDKEVEDLCVSGGNNTDPLSTLFVTSRTTGFTYNSYYCAICNEDVLDLVMWNALLRCDVHHFARVDFDDLVLRNNTWGVIDESGKVFHKCNVKSQRPQDIKNLTRQCPSPDFKTCPEDWQDEEVEALCHSYTDVLYYYETTYRNLHCALCNNETNLHTCYSSLRYAPPSFSVIFDFRDPSKSNLVGSTGPCNHTRIYDPFFGRCRSIVCPKPHQEYRYNKCEDVAGAATSNHTSPTEAPPSNNNTINVTDTKNTDPTDAPPLSNSSNVTETDTDSTDAPPLNINVTNTDTNSTDAPPLSNSSNVTETDTASTDAPRLSNSSNVTETDTASTDAPLLNNNINVTNTTDTDSTDTPPLNNINVTDTDTDSTDTPPVSNINVTDTTDTDSTDTPPLSNINVTDTTDTETVSTDTTPLNNFSDSGNTDAHFTEAPPVTNFTKEFLECYKIELSEGEYVFLDNTSAYVQKYERMYNQGEYASGGKEGDLLVCLPDAYRSPPQKFSAVLGWVSLAGLGLSCTGLLLHLAVFALLPELRNLSGRNLASLCVALLAAYITFLVNTLMQPGHVGCLALAAAMYYFFVASFTWMNAIAFDVWYTFHLTKRQLRVSSGSQWHRFIAYSLYSWLLPAAATLALLLVDQLEPSGVPEEFLPGLGRAWCWFSHRKALLAFFAAPMLTIIVVNCIFFVSTASIITNTSSTAAATSARGGHHGHHSLYKMYLRLAVLMGFTWLSGVAAGYLSIEALWYVFVLLNTLQGVFIFFAFTLRTKVWQGVAAAAQKRLQRGLSRVTHRPPPQAPDHRGFELHHTPEHTSSSTHTTSLAT